jgi:hypothetical protein
VDSALDLIRKSRLLEQDAAGQDELHGRMRCNQSARTGDGVVGQRSGCAFEDIAGDGIAFCRGVEDLDRQGGMSALLAFAPSR